MARWVSGGVSRLFTENPVEGEVVAAEPLGAPAPVFGFPPATFLLALEPWALVPVVVPVDGTETHRGVTWADPVVLHERREAAVRPGTAATRRESAPGRRGRRQPT